MLLMLLSFLLLRAGTAAAIVLDMGARAALLGTAELLRENADGLPRLGVAGAWLVWCSGNDGWSRCGTVILLAQALVPGPVHDRFVLGISPSTECGLK